MVFPAKTSAYESVVSGDVTGVFSKFKQFRA